MDVKMHDGSDTIFVQSCQDAGIPATARQYRKWKNNRGLARQANKRVEAVKLVEALIESEEDDE